MAENYRAKSYYKLYDLKIDYYSKEDFNELKSKDNTHLYVVNDLENYKIDLYIGETKLNSSDIIDASEESIKQAVQEYLDENDINVNLEDYATIEYVDNAIDNLDLVGDSYSPTAEVTETSNGAVITITDVNGTTTAEIKNGRSGVYVGSGDMPEDCNVQIDTDGEPINILTEEEVRKLIAEEVSGDIDLTGYATKQYVDDEINVIRNELTEVYATKQYIEDYINEALGGEY